MHAIGKKRASCDRCRYTPGIVKVSKRYERCHCGRLPNSTNEWKLTEQARLDNRLKDLKEGKPW
jgi:hypothetical protein